MISISRNYNLAANISNAAKWTQNATCNALLHSPASGLRRVQLKGFIQKRFKSFRPSYIHGLGIKAMTGATLGHFVDIIPESRFADREAIVDCPQGIRKTYIQYKNDIDQLAMGFLSLNLKRGDRLGILLPNRYEWAVAQFAAAKAGLILVTLNPAYQVPELEYCIQKLSVRCLLTQETFKTQEYYKMMTKIVPEISNSKPSTKVKSTKHPYFESLIVITDKDIPGAFKFIDIANAGGNAEKTSLEELQSKIQFNEPAAVLFTSGTTGAPKGATLSHHNLVNGSYTLTERLGFDKQHIRICVPLPFFHAMGCVSVTIGSIIHGNTAIIPSSSFDAGAVLKAIEEEKCSSVCGSPTMFIDMLHHPNFSKTDFSTITQGIFGGAPCPPHLIKMVMEKMHCPGLSVGYGATEICSGCFMNYPDDPVEERLYTVGRIYDHMEAKIIDKDGNIVPMGTSGEICFRGFKVMLGYWGEEEITREAITPDGWYKTGDVGVLNENGTLQVTERIKDMIIRGGENIYPREIEDILIAHPKITEAQVVGIPDERMGEEVCVWVRLKDNQTMEESEVKEFCKGKVAHFKIPRYIRFVTALPKTPTGKVKKYVIKQEMTKILELK